ncbi:MAG TPA: hypothetical protein DEA08_12030, partial [Planctomycetes bacterium]|nr:hypothetical protein [Planctomycetota bacterium]
GTPSYMSPEQANGQPCDPRSDLYSLGIVLYEALSGQRPFHGTPVQIVIQQLQSEPPPLRHSAPGTPPELVRIVERALRKPPSERWPDARALRGALEAFLAGEPSQAPARGRPGLAIVAALGCLGALGWGLTLAADQHSASPSPSLAVRSPAGVQRATPTKSLPRSLRPSESQPSDTAPATSQRPTQAAPVAQPSPHPQAEGRAAPLRARLLQGLSDLRRRAGRADPALRELILRAYARLSAEAPQATPSELEAGLREVLALDVELRRALRQATQKRRAHALAQARVALQCWAYAWRLSGSAPTAVQAARAALLRASRGGAPERQSARRALQAASAACELAAQRQRTERQSWTRKLDQLAARLGKTRSAWKEARDSHLPSPAQRGWGPALSELASTLERARGPRRAPATAIRLNDEVTIWEKRVRQALSRHAQEHAELERARTRLEALLRFEPALRRQLEPRLQAAARLSALDLDRARAAYQDLCVEVMAKRERAAALAGAERALDGLRRAFVSGDRHALEVLAPDAHEVLTRLVRRSVKRRLRLAQAELEQLDLASAKVSELSFFDRESGRQSRLRDYRVRLRCVAGEWRVVAFERRP